MEKKTIKKLPLTSDIVFKRVFAREGNEDILTALLEAILGISIKQVVVKNPELPPNLYDSKAGILDIKVEIDKNVICDIEMQVQDYHDIDKRNSYHNIARMKFEKTSKESYVDMGYKTEEEIATKYIEMHFIELKKFKKKNPDTKARINQWLWLLAGGEEKIEMAEKENKEVKKAVEILDEMSINKEERERYEAILKAEFNQKVSMYNIELKGKKEGEKNKGIEVAKKLLNRKVPIDEIVEITGLNKDEIEELKK